MAGKARCRVGALVALVVSTAGAVALPPAQGRAVDPAGDGLIVFVALDASGYGDLFAVRPDGSDRRELLGNSDLHEADPAVSPDGTRVAFSSNRAGGFEIYVMNLDGTGLTQLTDAVGSDTGPAWSPDGSQLVFSSQRDGQTELYSVASTGGAADRLTTSADGEYDPSYSPDGSSIVYQNNGQDGIQIYSIPARGGTPQRLTQDDTGGRTPDWSPDGTQIAFERALEAWVMDADGGNPHAVADGGRINNPSFSPDGSRLVYTSDAIDGVNDDIWSVALDGTDPRRITVAAADEWQPDWGPGPPLPGWVRQFGSASDDRAWGIAGTGGALFVTGETRGTLPGQASAGLQDGFLRRYDTDGNTVWTRQLGTAADDTGFDLDASADGGLFLVGQTAGAMPGQASAGGADTFVQRYDLGGTPVWTRQLGSAAADDPRAVAEYAGHVYVAGFTAGTLSGQTTSGGKDVFVTKLTADGAEVWTRQFGTALDDAGWGVAVDASGVYVSGHTLGVFDGQSKVGGTRDLFLRRYDLDGNHVWTRQLGTPGDDLGVAGVTLDPSGLYVAGWTGGAFAGAVPVGGLDGFVVAFDRDGAQTWARQFGSTLDDRVYGVESDAGHVAVVGHTAGALAGNSSAGASDMFTIALSASGVVGDAVQVGSGGSDLSGDLALLDGHAYLAGFTDGLFPGQTRGGMWDAVVLRPGAVQLDTTAPVVSDLADRPDPFNPREDRRAVIRFTLSERAEVSVRVERRDGTVVVRLRSGDVVPAGVVRTRWDGRNRSGRIVENGRYRYVVKAVDAAGNRSATRQGVITVRR